MTLTPLEQHCLDVFRRSGDCWTADTQAAEDDAWVQFALAAALPAVRAIRELRISPLSGEASFKDDDSPVTAQEHEIERLIRAHLARFCPDAVFLGEESGGQMDATGISVAVDPVDGTWALLNRMSTCAVVVAAFRQATPFLGAVANPATGEIGYAVTDRTTRLIQMDLAGERDVAVDMPMDRATPDSVPVNVHPARRVGSVLERLMAAWESDDVQMVRMDGGSPAAALLDAAKGTSVYVNLWDKRPSQPFDLAAGVMLVRNAGGRVVDLSGDDIDAVAHAGPFVAGIDEEARQGVVSVIASAPR
ncbi:MAG: inositol monophosphatase family protein [Planctomycetota bacterium]|jgi:myo-inositol-1(or 4)-monophosphatase